MIFFFYLFCGLVLYIYDQVLWNHDLLKILFVFSFNGKVSSLKNKMKCRGKDEMNYIYLDIHEVKSRKNCLGGSKSNVKKEALLRQPRHLCITCR